MDLKIIEKKMEDSQTPSEFSEWLDIYQAAEKAEQERVGKKAITLFLAALKNVQRDSTANITTKNGGSYSYTYTSLESIVELAREVGEPRGIAISQPPEENSSKELIINTIIRHESGYQESYPVTIGKEIINQSVLVGGNAIQNWGAIISYAKKYALASILFIGFDDPDGNINGNRQGNRQPQYNGGKPQGTTPPTMDFLKKIPGLEMSETESGDITVAGNQIAYGVRGTLKSLGFTFNPEEKKWVKKAAEVAQAVKLLNKCLDEEAAL